MKHTKRQLAFEVFKNFYLLLDVVVMLFPLLFMIFCSFKTHDEISASPFALGASPFQTFAANLGAVMSGEVTRSIRLTPYFTMFLNSAIYTVGALVLMLITGTMCSYALGRFKFRIKKYLIFFILLVQIIPFFGYMVPLFFNINRMNMLNNYFAVILVYTGISLPGTIVLMLGFFQSFPAEIEDAALIDGCGDFRKFLFIVLPVSRGIIASMALINFMGFWNEFVIVSLLVKDASMYPINVGVIIVKSNQMGSGGHLDYIMTLLVMSALPNMILFTVFQKGIVQGIAQGSVKG